MVGILLVGHGALAHAMLDTARMLVGDCGQVRAVGLEPGQPIDEFAAQVGLEAAALDDGDGVVILADLQGGSPCRAAALYMADRANVEVLAGVNLPMLAEGLICREGLTPRELAARLREGGVAGIVDVGHMLRES